MVFRTITGLVLCWNPLDLIYPDFHNKEKLLMPSFSDLSPGIYSTYVYKVKCLGRK